VALQDEWDDREMSNLRMYRRRVAEANAQAEISVWGCDTDSVGGYVAADGGEGGLGAAAGGRGGGEGAGVDEFGERVVPYQPVADEEWQVAAPVPAGGRTVRQLTHVNGVEADELTLAELHASVLSEDALSLAQEGDSAAVSYVVRHVVIFEHGELSVAEGKISVAEENRSVAEEKRSVAEEKISVAEEKRSIEEEQRSVESLTANIAQTAIPSAKDAPKGVVAPDGKGATAHPASGKDLAGAGK
ncbi:unnamed protein product, partial [Laminaria digitata]